MRNWLKSNHHTVTSVAAILVSVTALYVAWDQSRVMRAQQHGAGRQGSNGGGRDQKETLADRLWSGSPASHSPGAPASACNRAQPLLS